MKSRNCWVCQNSPLLKQHLPLLKIMETPSWIIWEISPNKPILPTPINQYHLVIHLQLILRKWHEINTQQIKICLPIILQKLFFLNLLSSQAFNISQFFLVVGHPLFTFFIEEACRRSIHERGTSKWEIRKRNIFAWKPKIFSYLFTIHSPQNHNFKTLFFPKNKLLLMGIKQQLNAHQKKTTLNQSKSMNQHKPICIFSLWLSSQPNLQQNKKIYIYTHFWPLSPVFLGFGGSKQYTQKL